MSKKLLVVAVVVMGAALATALAKPVTEFLFKFDTKGDLEGWKANENSEATWQEPGAAASPGAMKVTGKHASVDSPPLAFKTADNVVSFDYFLHGYDTLRLRLNITKAEDKEKYGAYGNFFIRRAAQDKWVHVDIKLADVEGMAEGKPKLGPDVELKSISLITMERAGDDAYMLIDNVKMGKTAESAPATATAPAAAQ